MIDNIIYKIQCRMSHWYGLLIGQVVYNTYWDWYDQKRKQNMQGKLALLFIPIYGSIFNLINNYDKVNELPPPKGRGLLYNELLKMIPITAVAFLPLLIISKLLLERSY